MGAHLEDIVSGPPSQFKSNATEHQPVCIRTTSQARSELKTWYGYCTYVHPGFMPRRSTSLNPFQVKTPIATLQHPVLCKVAALIISLNQHYHCAEQKPEVMSRHTTVRRMGKTLYICSWANNVNTLPFIPGQIQTVLPRLTP